MIYCPCRQCHVGQCWILHSGRRHAGPIGHIYILAEMQQRIHHLSVFWVSNHTRFSCLGIVSAIIYECTRQLLHFPFNKLSFSFFPISSLSRTTCLPAPNVAAHPRRKSASCLYTFLKLEI